MKLLQYVLVCCTFLCFFMPRAVNACGNNQATTFTFPLSNWEETCGFDVTCASTHHMGIDGEPTSGDVIGATAIAPCTGIVKEAQYHNGYGGMVILECWTGSECVSPFVAHLNANTLQVRAGDNVTVGKTILGYIADSQNNGGWAPHIHYGIRKGGYSSFVYSGCSSAVWSYAGYPGDCYAAMVNDMHSPTSFTNAHQSTCATTTDYYPVPLTYVSASGNALTASTWWQEDSASALIPYGSVAELASGAVKTSFSGKFTADSLDDILTSYSANNTRYIVVFSATSDGGFNAAKEWYRGSEDSIDKILVGDKDNNNNISNINNVLLQLCTKKQYFYQYFFYQ